MVLIKFRRIDDKFISFIFMDFCLEEKLAAPCFKSMMPLSILKWHQIDGCEGILEEHIGRANSSLNSSTFQISNPNLPSHSQQIFSVTNISSKGLNFIFCEELLQREVRNAATMAAPPPFRKREVFMAFWDLNPLDILRQSPSITQLDHEPGNSTTTTKSSNFWEPPKKRIKKEEKKKKLSAEGWTFLRYFLPPSAKMLNGL